MFMCHNIYSKLYNSFRWCRMLHYINSFLKPDSLYILSFSDCTQWCSVSLDMILITVRLNLKESWNLQLSLNCITSSNGDELWKNLPDLNRYVVYIPVWIITDDGLFLCLSPLILYKFAYLAVPMMFRCLHLNLQCYFWDWGYFFMGLFYVLYIRSYIF